MRLVRSFKTDTQAAALDALSVLAELPQVQVDLVRFGAVRHAATRTLARHYPPRPRRVPPTMFSLCQPLPRAATSSQAHSMARRAQAHATQYRRIRLAR